MWLYIYIYTYTHKSNLFTFFNWSHYLDLPYTVSYPLAICGYLQLNWLTLNKLKTQCLSHISHISSAIHMWLVGSADKEHLLNSPGLDNE